MRNVLIPLLLLSVAACAKPGTYPSLNVRPIEGKASGLLTEPAAEPTAVAPATPAVQAKVDAAIAAARAGAQAFDSDLPATRSAAAAAGASGSEGWIAAQMAISALERSRAPVKMALSDLDAMLRAALSAPPGEDLARIEAAIRSVEAIDAQQTDAMDALLRSVSR